jgi:spore germination protein KC
MWAHNNVVIIGESLARQGISPVVDFFTHNPELRMKTLVVIAKGDAKDYVSAKTGMEKPSGLSFVNIESYRGLSAESVASDMQRLSTTLRSPYSNPIISTIYRKKNITELSDGGSPKEAETINLSGAAIFKKDKMIGWLSPKETQGIAWILNQTERTLVTVVDPKHKGKSVSVETAHVKVKYRTKVIHGVPHFLIRISGRGNIVEEDGITSQSMRETKANIEQLMKRKLSAQIKKSLQKVQKKYRSDILGWAAIVHSQNNAQWERGLSDRWDKVFPRILVRIAVKIDIKASTLNQQPFHSHLKGK